MSDFLNTTNEGIKGFDAITSSSGTSDADKMIKTGSDGKLNANLLTPDTLYKAGYQWDRTNYTPFKHGDDLYQGYVKQGQTEIVIKKTTKMGSTYVKTSTAGWNLRTSLTYGTFSSIL